MESIHLTLAFLGDVEEGALPLLRGLQVKGEGHFLPIDQAGFWQHNRIVWVGPDALPVRLKDLVTNLQAELNANSFQLEKRPFAAHTTLIRNARAPSALPALPEVRWPVEECLLVESRPEGAGRSYEILARYALA